MCYLFYTDLSWVSGNKLSCSNVYSYSRLCSKIAKKKSRKNCVWKICPSTYSRNIKILPSSKKKTSIVTKNSTSISINCMLARLKNRRPSRKNSKSFISIPLKKNISWECLTNCQHAMPTSISPNLRWGRCSKKWEWKCAKAKSSECCGSLMIGLIKR